MKMCSPLVCVVSCLLATFVWAQDEKPDDKETPKIESVKITRVAVEIDDTLDGIFESTDTTEIRTKFENWTDLKVKRVAEEGGKVEKGAVLIVFDDESIKKANDDAQVALEAAKLAFQDAQLVLNEIDKTLDMDHDIAERNWKNAQDDYEYYLKVTVPQRQEDHEYSLRTSRYSVEYTRDELDQLKQMYEEDELTEESEMIVLKRAERSVESAERGMKRTIQRLDHQKKFSFPRQDKTMADTIKRQKVEFEKAKVVLPNKRMRALIALRKAEIDLKNKREKLDELEEDLQRMTIKAPVAGLVYYGQCVKGKWVGPTATPVRDIKVGNKLAADKVVMTLVDDRAVQIRSSLTEAQLGVLKPAMDGTALTTAESHRLPVSLTAVTRIPNSKGKFDCLIAIEQRPQDSSIMPGMTCKVAFRTFNEEALVAPKASVFSNDGGVSHHVFVVEDNVAVKRAVVVGRESGENVLILDGLDEGVEIAKKKQ